MNDHLQTLFDQAFEYARTNGCSNRAVVEKFAELIVRECADVCSNVLDYHAILEKFGVEE